MLFYEIFLNIRDITLEASIFALVVMVLRLIFKKAPKWVRCFMWALVAIRLVVPFYFFEIPVDYIPDTPIVSEQTSSQTEPPAEIVKPDNRVDNIISNPPLPDRSEPIISESVVPEVAGNSSADNAEKKYDYERIAYSIWLAGVCIMLLYAIISYIRLRRRVRTSISLRENQWICDEIKSPFILGFIKPRIYLPSSLQDETLRHVISHEKAHLKRKDYLWKPFGFILLSLNWFNPIMWLSYILLCRDIELACDEKVIKEMGVSDKKAYSEALLSCSSSHKLITACPVAFGEVGVKQRIKSVLSYKKPAFWVIIVAVIVSIVVAIWFMTGTKEIVTENTTDTTSEAVSTEPDSELTELWLKNDVWKYNRLFSTYGYSQLHLYVAENYEITGYKASSGTLSEITDVGLLKLNGVRYEPENGETNEISITINTVCESRKVDFNITLTNIGVDGGTTFYQLSTEDKNFSRLDSHYRYIFDEEGIDISEYLDIPEPILLADKIPNTPDWARKVIASVGLGEAFYESVTDFSLGKVYLLGCFVPSDNYRHQYLAVETESYVFFEDIDASYGSQIYLCDVDGVAGEEIILNQMVGAAGGGGAYNSSVYRITENGLQLIYYSAAYQNSSGFESKLEAPFTVRITNSYTGYELMINFRGVTDYVGTVFDEAGTPIADSDFSRAYFDSFLGFAPVDIDADGIYEIECIQYTSLYSHADCIGLARSVLRYNENTGKFDVVVAEFTPEAAEDVPEAYWDYNPYASAEFHYVTQFVLPDGYEIKSAEASDGTATVDILYNRPDGIECVKWSPGFYEDGTSKETDLIIEAVKDGKDIEFKLKITEVYDENTQSDLALKTYKITPINCKMRVVTTATYYIEEK